MDGDFLGGPITIGPGEWVRVQARELPPPPPKPRPFEKASPWIYQPMPHKEVDPASDLIVRRLAASAKKNSELTTRDYAIPVVEIDGVEYAKVPSGYAGESPPQYTTHGLTHVHAVPGGISSPGSDGWLVAVLPNGRTEEYYRLKMAGDFPGVAKTVASFDSLYGSCVSTLGSCNAGGYSNLPMLVTKDEQKAGPITHRLSISVPGISSSKPRGHATKSVVVQGAVGFPAEGTEGRLKESADISHLTGRVFEIALAMKTYGFECRDNSGVVCINGQYTGTPNLKLMGIPWGECEIYV